MRREEAKVASRTGFHTIERWHLNTVGTDNIGGETVGEDVGGSEGQNKDS